MAYLEEWIKGDGPTKLYDGSKNRKRKTSSCLFGRKKLIFKQKIFAFYEQKLETKLDGDLFEWRLNWTKISLSITLFQKQLLLFQNASFPKFISECTSANTANTGEYLGGGRWDRPPPPPLSKCIVNCFVKNF